MRLRFLSCLCALLLTGPAFAAPEADPPAEKLRKALDQPRDFEIVNQPLTKFAALLAEQTGIPFRVDAALQPLPLPSLNGLQLSGPPFLSLRGSKRRVGPALNAVLAPHGMTHVILAGQVLLTTSDRAAHFALRQKLNVLAEKETLEVVCKRLARETAVDVVFDPQAREKINPLSLRLSNVSLETAVQVLAVSSGLEAVRLDNVLFVTTSARAKSLRAAATDLRTPLPTVPQSFGAMGGGGLMGFMGGGGMAGLHGAFGIGGGLAGNVGALGIGGGMAGQRGGLMGMVGGAGFRGGAPPKQKPKEKPNKKPDRAVGKAAQADAGLMLVAAHSAAPAPKPVPARPQYRLPAQLRATRDLLNVPQTEFKEIDDPSITLNNMLNALSKKFSRPQDTPPFFLTFMVNERAFKAAGVPMDKLLNTAIAEQKFPGAVNLSLSRYLRRLLERCPGTVEFILRKDGVEITTRKAVLAEFYGNRSKKELESTLPPLVNVAFDRQPLDEVLEELARTTEGFNIVLNGAVKDKKTAVSATFRNVPVDTAVWTLADMAGLTVERKGNVLYVTHKQPARGKKHRKR